MTVAPRPRVGAKLAESNRRNAPGAGFANPVRGNEPVALENAGQIGILGNTHNHAGFVNYLIPQGRQRIRTRRQFREIQAGPG
jgi:hypothetical protein